MPNRLQSGSGRKANNNRKYQISSGIRLAIVHTGCFGKGNWEAVWKKTTGGVGSSEPSLYGDRLYNPKGLFSHITRKVKGRGGGTARGPGRQNKAETGF